LSSKIFWTGPGAMGVSEEATPSGCSSNPASSPGGPSGGGERNGMGLSTRWNGVIHQVEWGYPPGSKKAHCFKSAEDPNLKTSLCGKLVTFTYDLIDENLVDNVYICFNCLLMYVRRGEEKP